MYNGEDGRGYDDFKGQPGKKDPKISTETSYALFRDADILPGGKCLIYSDSESMLLFMREWDYNCLNTLT